MATNTIGAKPPTTESPTIVLIGGGSAAGKTTLAREVTEQAEYTSIIEMDRFYEDISDLTHDEKVARNLDDPGKLRWDRLVSVLEDVSSGMDVTLPHYDFETGVVDDEATEMTPGAVCIVEGIWALDERVREFGDISVFVDADPDTRLIRRTRRDVDERDMSLDEIIDDFEEHVKPMHDKHIEPTKRKADIILNGGYSEVGVRAILGAANGGGDSD